MNRLEMTDIALRFSGFNWKKRGVEHVLRIIDLVEEKGEKVTVEDIARIESELEEKYEK